jgi:excinuclease UvrABC nuclease subunit
MSLPRVSCCYVIYLDGRLKYIGSTNDLRNRFSGHAFRYGYGRNIHTPWGDFSDDIKFIIKYKPSKKYGDWLMIEARLIRKLRPEYNKKLKRRAKK